MNANKMVFLNLLHPCALDESSLSIERVKQISACLISMGGSRPLKSQATRQVPVIGTSVRACFIQLHLFDNSADCRITLS